MNRINDCGRLFSRIILYLSLLGCLFFFQIDCLVLTIYSPYRSSNQTLSINQIIWDALGYCQCAIVTISLAYSMVHLQERINNVRIINNKGITVIVGFIRILSCISMLSAISLSLLIMLPPDFGEAKDQYIWIAVYLVIIFEVVSLIYLLLRLFRIKLSLMTRLLAIQSLKSLVRILLIISCSFTIVLLSYKLIVSWNINTFDVFLFCTIAILSLLWVTLHSAHALCIKRTS